jgi:hypothetical protein
MVMNEIHCSCVIHGDAYSWDYVEKLYRALQQNLTPKVILHVFTEAERYVPPNMIHHPLQQWVDVSGPKKAWWYKIQLFNPKNYNGQILYFDLDVVIINNIDWMWQLDTRYFWAVRDFTYLFRMNTASSVNSSIMWFNTAQFAYVFANYNIDIPTKFRGDQDYINSIVPYDQKQYMDSEKVRSWRWEILDGGLNFKTRLPYAPNAGPLIPTNTSVMVFHGVPKPSDSTKYSIVANNWR